MNLTEKFLSFALLGAQWVLWLLIALSVVSVAIMIDRALYFAKRKIDFDELKRDVLAAFAKSNIDGLLKKYDGNDAIEAKTACAALREAHRGPDSTAEAVAGVKVRKRQEMERNVAFLGTVGNNAPFIGLFGTVLGIIRAFHDLADNDAAAKKVMTGISEALVATAIGLLVAIPAVVTCNYFQRRIRASISNTDAIAHAVLAELHGGARTAPGEAKGAA